MGTAAFIAGDWGTTHLRLVLCDANGTTLESIDGPGISQIERHFETVFDDLTAAWSKQRPQLPALLCGMVGSTIGWTDVPYVACPAQPGALARSMVAIPERHVLIAPGLSCRNRHDAPDVMRGEETQILGAIRLDASLARGRHLLCLPGTHTKWVVLDEGVIREFITSATGEMFAIVNQHSVLIRAGRASAEADAAFERAIDQVKRFPAAALTQLLFECRSRQVMNELTSAAAPHFLSGLLIGQDVAAVRSQFADVLDHTRRIVLVGTPHLTALHAIAASVFGLESLQIDGSHAALAGLTSLYQHRFGEERTDAA